MPIATARQRSREMRQKTAEVRKNERRARKTYDRMQKSWKWSFLVLPIRRNHIDYCRADKRNFCAGAQRRRFLFRIWSFKRSRVLTIRPMLVMKKRAKHRMVSASVTVSIYNGDFSSRFSRCRRKVRLRGEGMICRDPKKSTFFDLLIIQIVLNYAVLDRSETHSSRPRTYLPSRSGATHALRVQSS